MSIAQYDTDVKLRSRESSKSIDRFTSKSPIAGGKAISMSHRPDSLEQKQMKSKAIIEHAVNPKNPSPFAIKQKASFRNRINHVSQEITLGKKTQNTFFGNRNVKRGSLQEFQNIEIKNQINYYCNQEFTDVRSSLEGDKRNKAPMFIANEMGNDYGDIAAVLNNQQLDNNSEKSANTQRIVHQQNAASHLFIKENNRRGFSQISSGG